ncbi:MAG: ATP-binding protein [Pseudomonadota bacterium]
MSSTHPTLHMLCGKIAAGKSTLASSLANRSGTVLIAEDDWLSALFADELHSLSDFVRCTKNLRNVLGPHIVSLLNAGVTVVLDFHANTIESRAWMRGMLDKTDADHQLHVLEIPDALCLSRLRQRNTSGKHPFAPTEEQFHQFSRHYVPPSPDEGFHLVVHEKPA